MSVTSQAFRNAFHVPYADPANNNVVTVVTGGDTYTTQWASASGGAVSEAPADGKTYGRKDLGWIESVTKAYVDNGLSLKLDASLYTAADVLAKVMIADGTGSGLDADLLDGQHASAFATTAGLALKADLASPTFTGDPKAPTPATADNDTSIATTAYVKAQGYLTSAVTSVSGTAPVVSSGGNTPAISMPAASGSVSGYLTSGDWTTFNNKAPLASPTFTGTPAAVTAAPGTNTTQLATTAFVAAAIAGLGGGSASITVSDTAPGSPSAGALWWESDSGRLMIYFDASWVEIGTGGGAITPEDEVIGGSITISSSAPGSPSVGDVWIDTT